GEIEQPKLPDLLMHLADGVAAEHAVRRLQQPEIAQLPVVDVERAGPFVAGHHNEQQHAFGVLDPVSDYTLRSGHELGNNYLDILFRWHFQIFRAEHTARAHTISIHVGSPLM